MACRELGFVSGTQSDGNAPVDLFYHDVVCTGSETSLADCSHGIGEHGHVIIFIRRHKNNHSRTRWVAQYGNSVPSTGLDVLEKIYDSSGKRSA